MELLPDSLKSIFYPGCKENILFHFKDTWFNSSQCLDITLKRKIFFKRIKNCQLGGLHEEDEMSVFPAVRCPMGCCTHYNEVVGVNLDYIQAHHSCRFYQGF